MRRGLLAVMDSLKLGLVGLPAAEASLVATLFRLHRVEPSFIWSLAEAGPFDAVLADASVPDERLHAVANACARVKRLMPAGQAAAGEGLMSRPIRSDLLVAWLNSIEVEILNGSGNGFAPTAAQPGLVSSIFGGLPDRVAMVPVPRQALVAQRFKLLRWPSAAILAGNLVRIRAATLLSRRPMTLVELSTVAGMPLNLCEGFVGELTRFGLLETSQAPSEVVPTPTPARQDAVAPASPDPARAGFGRALISSIRRRFGMG